MYSMQAAFWKKPDSTGVGLMKIGICIDRYKKKLFKRNLKAGGFTVTEGEGVTKDTLLLYVEIEAGSFEVLRDVIEKSNRRSTRLGH